MTTTTKPDPRPIAATRCWDCGAGPDTDPAGDPHGWSCEQVPPEMFRNYFRLNSQPGPEENPR